MTRFVNRTSSGTSTGPLTDRVDAVRAALAMLGSDGMVLFTGRYLELATMLPLLRGRYAVVVVECVA